VKVNASDLLEKCAIRGGLLPVHSATSRRKRPSIAIRSSNSAGPRMDVGINRYGSEAPALEGDTPES